MAEEYLNDNLPTFNFNKDLAGRRRSFCRLYGHDIHGFRRNRDIESPPKNVQFMLFDVFNDRYWSI